MFFLEHLSVGQHRGNVFYLKGSYALCWLAPLLPPTVPRAATKMPYVGVLNLGRGVPTELTSPRFRILLLT